MCDSNPQVDLSRFTCAFQSRTDQNQPIINLTPVRTRHLFGSSDYSAKPSPHFPSSMPNLAQNQNHHPDCSAVVILLLPDCPLRIGLSICVRFSQSFTHTGLLATVSGQRRPVVSAMPLGSKCFTSQHSPLMHLVYPSLKYVPVPQ
jgi:hypothetical protein